MVSGGRGMDDWPRALKKILLTVWLTTSLLLRWRLLTKPFPLESLN